MSLSVASLAPVEAIFLQDHSALPSAPLSYRNRSNVTQPFLGVNRRLESSNITSNLSQQNDGRISDEMANMRRNFMIYVFAVQGLAGV